MGTDKALLKLAGKPLAEHAVVKLRRICADVHILSSNPALAEYAPLVGDLHPGCGPLSGIEAALAHSRYDWNVILPVDVPFLPTALLGWWLWEIVGRRRPPRIRVAYFSVFGRPQPALLLIHRETARHLTAAIVRGEYKLLPALERTAAALAPPDAQPRDKVPYVLPIDEQFVFDWDVLPPDLMPWHVLTPAQRAAQPFWFANLNTPEDFAHADAHADALDT